MRFRIFSSVILIELIKDRIFLEIMTQTQLIRKATVLWNDPAHANSEQW